MASPQPDQHTRLSNEILEKLAMIRISGEARQMLDVILRKTYGWGKKNDDIATSQFMQLTGLKAFAVHKARRKLLDMNLITITKKGNGITQKGYSQVLNYTFQKDYDKWLPLPKKVTVTKKGIQVLPKKVIRCNPKGGTQKKDKETIQKKEEISLFWDYYLLKVNKKFKLTPDKSTLIRNRLKDYLLNDLKKAVDNFVIDDWADRKNNLDLIYCIGKQQGKRDNLDYWLNIEVKKQPTLRSDKPYVKPEYRK